MFKGALELNMDHAIRIHHTAYIVTGVSYES